MYAAARAALALVVDRPAELRRDDHVVAPRAERPAEQHLALRAAVDVGGVEEGDARVERGVDHRRGRRLVDPAAEVVAAETDHRGVELADAASFHPASLPRVAPGRQAALAGLSGSLRRGRSREAAGRRDGRAPPLVLESTVNHAMTPPSTARAAQIRSATRRGR